jgi:hypothetical protein
MLWPRASPRARAVGILVEHARRVMSERAGAAGNGR